LLHDRSICNPLCALVSQKQKHLQRASEAVDADVCIPQIVRKRVPDQWT